MDRKLQFPEVQINSKTYRLARQVFADRIGGRIWSEEKLPKPIAFVNPGNIIAGTQAGEYILRLDDFSNGIAGDRDQTPGVIHYAEFVDCSSPNRFRPNKGSFASTYINKSQATGSAFLGIFNKTLYWFAGRYVYKVLGQSLTEIKDFGVGIAATDVIEWNSTLVIGFGGSTNKIQTMDTAELFTAATDATYADYFAVVQDRLWRSTNSNEVSNIAAAANPNTLANWSAAITVGDDDIPITDLNSYGEQLAVSKEDGLYLGDVNAIFPNVLPQIVSRRDGDNGKNTVSIGSYIYYIYRGGILRYSLGVSEEIGLEKVFTSTNLAETTLFPPMNPGVSCLLADGTNIWAFTKPSIWPRADPTTVKIDDAGVFTSHTANLIDNAYGTGMDIDVVGAADKIYVRFSALSVAYGVFLDLKNINTNSVTATVNYWNGAWVAFNSTHGFVNDTIVSSKPFARSGAIYWTLQPTDWVSTSVDGEAGIWIQITLSGAPSTDTVIDELRVITVLPTSCVLYGRPSNNKIESPIIWQQLFWSRLPKVTVAAINPYDTYGNELFYAGNDAITQATLDGPVNPSMLYASTSTGARITTPRYSLGDSNTVKDILEVRVKSKNADANRTAVISYRLDEGTGSFTSIGTINADNEIFGLNISGYLLQLDVLFTLAAYDEQQEINCIDVVFRFRNTYWKKHKLTLEIADNTPSSEGAVLPEAAAQVSNLESILGSGGVAYIDPIGRASDTFRLESMRIAEQLQDEFDNPVLLAEVEMLEIV